MAETADHRAQAAHRSPHREAIGGRIATGDPRNKPSASCKRYASNANGFKATRADHPRL